jgi:hypothetical protein
LELTEILVSSLREKIYGGGGDVDDFGMRNADFGLIAADPHR